MFDLLMLIVNKMRGLGFKEITNHYIVRRLLQAISPRNPTLVTLIQERHDFNKLTPNDVLGRILALELMKYEVKEVKNIMKHGSHSKSKDITLFCLGTRIWI